MTHASPLTIGQLLRTPLANTPGQEIIHADVMRYSYAGLWQRIRRLGAALTDLGVGAGSVVAVLDWDSHRYLECFFAVPMLGAVLHTVNVRLAPEQVLYTINHAADEVILVHEDFLPLIGAIAARIIRPVRFVLLQDRPGPAATALPLAGEYEGLLAASDGAFRFPELDENTRATLFYTTGTTGDPKGVTFTHRQIVLHTLAVIAAVARTRPGLRQIACFDTAFHATIPEVGWRYALPDLPETRGIRRYGFHGLSYASLAARLPAATGGPLPRRLLAAHLGNGASLCAIRDGRSVATTMGYSPLGGLTMGTRTGEIDGNAVLEIARRAGIDRASDILNRESGLKGLGGASDMRALQAAGTPGAAFAVDHFIHWAVHHAGAMVADMGGIDALVFTGGIGENAAGLRAGIMRGLSYLGLDFDAQANERGATTLHLPGSRVQALVHPADEESWIVEEARRILSGGQARA